MDGRRFDAWTRALATGAVNRRAASRLLIGGALGTPLVRHQAAKAAGGCTKAGRPCVKDRECCSTFCRNGNCQCFAWLTNCGGDCVDVKGNDPRNCGGCGLRCGSRTVQKECRRGRCCRSSGEVCPTGCLQHSRCQQCCTRHCGPNRTCERPA
jgi:hypothetical protein